MNRGRSDASTSTDDVKARPLCLFYFTHPFGVLSPEPPLLAAAPAHLARAYVNMQPVSPFFWSSTDEYNTNSTSDVTPATPTHTTRLNYDLGKATVHKNPVNIVSVARTRKCTIDLGSARDTISSSLFSSDVWFSSGSSSRSFEYTRRVIPYHRILPPLQLPPPRDSSSFESSDDVWPSKCINPEKFSLPPIELPVWKNTSSEVVPKRGRAVSAVSSAESSVRVRCRRRLGVVKQRRTRLSGVRRLLACLTRRTLRGVCGRSLRLQDALATLRDAWAEPVSLLSRCRRAITLSSLTRESALSRETEQRASEHRMLTQLAELAPRGGASPGLLRRRYSVPETIMRKYKLAQQRSESEEAVGVTSASPASASPSLCESPRSPRRDRELMRKSALLRRMWGRPHNVCCCSEVCEQCCGRETRSLDTSRSELRPLSCSSGLAVPPPPSGWATPKRQRLDSSRDFRGSDEMLRTAMRNSYDRAEESRCEQSKYNLSDSTRSGREVSSCIESMTEPLTDSDSSKLDDRNEPNRTQESQILTLDSSTMEVDSSSGNHENLEYNDRSHRLIDDHSLTDDSESFSVSMSTTKENQAYSGNREFKQISSSAHIEGRISERSVSVENDDTNMMPYDTPLTVDTPSYELLEIVVSESYNGNPMQNNKNTVSETRAIETIKSPVSNHWKKMQDINIDEYVSNILVESLNSLTDQIECMNASMCNDRKVSIVEKEIKLKLQNTGVNTIVHLSPKSNNQIIFGNEELCNSFDNKDNCNNPRDSVTIREEPHSAESNNNPPSSHSLHEDAVFSVVHNDNVNRAVLQQIQKLFQDELNSFDNGIHYTNNTMPGISHIEISNVDVFIDNNTASTAEVTEADAIDLGEVISCVGPGNYFPDGDDSTVVPRFSAMPHTDSMEVNTSSSDDPDNIGSGCTSLVDSLDDPNSPRSVFLRRAHNNSKRNELVRSAIDVLDLLPENSYNNYASPPKDKGEAFFIRIKDNNFDCEKENVIVADHMPEKIKQRLYRRQRKREMRMECARRSKVKEIKKEIEKQSRKDISRSKEVERECLAIINALIDDVIVKIVHDEHKCMRIKQKNSRMVASKSDENVSRRNWKKDLEYNNNKKSSKIKSSSSSSGTINIDRKNKHSDKPIHGKLSLLPHPPLSPDTSGPRRIYQKSEIHDGNKCIEILEILEYVNSSHSKSSPDITNSDENQNDNTRHRKSRIPIPVYEKLQKISSDSPKAYRSSAHKTTSPQHRAESKSNRTLTDMLLQVLADECSGECSAECSAECSPPARRASVPAGEPRARSSSLRFKQMFDIIPEERSLSVDSSNEDVAYNRRSSAPSVSDTVKLHYDDSNISQIGPSSQNEQNEISEALRSTASRYQSRKPKEMKSAGTSPLSSDGDKMKTSRVTMTSPSRRSAATSPIRTPSAKNQKHNSQNQSSCSQTTTSSGGTSGARGKRGLASRGRGWLGFTRPHCDLLDQGSKEKNVETETRDRRSVLAHDQVVETRRTVRTIQTEKVDPIIVGGDKHRSKSKAIRRFEHDEAKTKKRANRPKSESQANEKDEKEATQESFQSRAEAGGVRLPECARSPSSSSSSESGGGLLCSLAPKWLSAPARRRHAARRRDQGAPADPTPITDAGGWSVTVAGSCRAALPADVEMRLRFPPDQQPPPPPPPLQPALPRPESQRAPQLQEEWSCVSRRCPQCACACCTGAPPAPRRPPPLPPAPAQHNPDTTGRLTLTMKKEALGSSVVASKTAKKFSDPLPELETYTATRSQLKSSVKTRRGYSLHCWLPDDEPALLRTNNGLSVLGSAIIPELKPRVRTMSERDLTRHYTPRHYLRC